MTNDERKAAPQHECKFPEPSHGLAFDCLECGVMWQWDEVSEVWESVGGIEEVTATDRLESAIRWALGEIGDFRPRGTGEGAYWWRKELRQRAFGDVKPVAAAPAQAQAQPDTEAAFRAACKRMGYQPDNGVMREMFNAGLTACEIATKAEPLVAAFEPRAQPQSTRSEGQAKAVFEGLLDDIEREAWEDGSERAVYLGTVKRFIAEAYEAGQAAQAQAPTPAIFPDCNIGTAHECCVARMKRLEKERYGINWRAEEGAPTPTPDELEDRMKRQSALLYDLLREDMRPEWALPTIQGSMTSAYWIGRLDEEEAAKSPAQPAPQPDPRWKQLFTQFHDLWGRCVENEEYSHLMKAQFGRMLHLIHSLEQSASPVASETPQAPSEKEK